MKITDPLTVNRPPQFPRRPPRIHPWFGLWMRRGTEGRPGVLGRSGRYWVIWPRVPRLGSPQCFPWWRASAGSVGWFSLMTPRPLSSPPGLAWVWPCGSETKWWPARWRAPAAARSGLGRPEKDISGTKTSSPVRKSDDSWRPSATFSSFSTSASVRKSLCAHDLGGCEKKKNIYKEESNNRKGHFPFKQQRQQRALHNRPVIGLQAWLCLSI